jgi:23S rRNA (cytosine1962-C5)-methyltransferase
LRLAECANLRAISLKSTEQQIMSVRLVLAKGREKSLLRRHPWVFSGAVARMEGKASLGETIDIVDHQGKWLARGAYSPASQIRARVWTFDKDETIDIDFFVRRLQQAQQWRDGWQNVTVWTAIA